MGINRLFTFLQPSNTSLYTSNLFILPIFTKESVISSVNQFYEDFTDFFQGNNSHRNTNSAAVEINEISLFEASFFVDICYILEIKALRNYINIYFREISITLRKVWRALITGSILMLHKVMKIEKQSIELEKPPSVEVEAGNPNRKKWRP